jgi:hypothetical protein
VLLLWLAGWEFSSGNGAGAQEVLFRRDRYGVTREVEKALKEYSGEAGARRLQRLFPLSADDADRIGRFRSELVSLAKELVARFSPRWLFGWRDITNAANERTMIATVFPSTAIGHTFPLAFIKGLSPLLRLAVVANLNSFVADYIARQKVGGTHITYGLLNQFAILPPNTYAERFLDNTLLEFVTHRVLELVYTARDLEALASDCGYEGPPFRWDESRRFQIRAELDAAYLHAYLGSSDAWHPLAGETLADLVRHFPTPADAATHLLNSFWLVREKDEGTYRSYRTRDTILTLYKAFSAAHRTGVAWRSPLDPPAGKASVHVSAC